MSYTRRIITGHGNTVIVDMDCTCSTGKRLKNQTRQSKFDEKSNSGKVQNNKDDENIVIVLKEKDGEIKKDVIQKKKVTRCVGTSPQLDLKREASPLKRAQLSPLRGVDNVQNPNRVLEKSNSLGEKKPQRLLRTTRSLSPRPPVKHQTAITISDENDIVSIKLSPHEIEFNDVFNQRREKLQPFSERPSPNLSEFSMFKGSDSHLVYVPTDPWLKMPDNMLKKQTENEDPWVWRSTSNIVDEKKANNKKGKLAKDEKIWKSTTNILSNDKPKHPKQMAYRQTKSFSCKDYDDILNGKQLKLLVKTEEKPIIQRSKSPITIVDSIENDIPPKSPRLSPHKTNLSPAHHQTSIINEPQLSISSASSATVNNTKRNTLNLPNSNLLQPRHSFSTPSQKDDELPLNIRRLSEQIRYAPSYLVSSNSSIQSQNIIAPPSNFDEQKINSNGNKTNLAGNKLNDPMLETTC